LLHVLRNALDHGIETPAEREAAGKPALATLWLRARRDGEFVVVEVEDDGRGIDIANIRRIAVERGVIEAAEERELSDAEVLDLIFAPGFSTATQVTDLSGRGVGMNAVRNAVGHLAGSVQVSSRTGVGTTVSLRLPFSILMTRVMTVDAGGQMFGINLDCVLETARIPREQISAVGAAQAFVLRERTIPLIHLGKALGQGESQPDNQDAHVMVFSLAGRLGSLEVDRLGDRLDVMLAPAEGLLKGVPGIAGTALLGDGRVLVVLDLQELLG
jgi:two-component system chemotaxis sensor kinase CheA